MPFPPRRGRLNKRCEVTTNVVKQSLSGQGRRVDRNPPRRVPHYEEDPHWVNRLPAASEHDGHMPAPHPGQDRPAPPNPRGSWGPRRKGQGRGAGQQGKGLRQSEPPLVWQGIPHLEHSFVMQKGEQERGNERGVLPSDAIQAMESAPEASVGSDSNTLRAPEPSELNPRLLSDPAGPPDHRGEHPSSSQGVLRSQRGPHVESRLENTRDRGPMAFNSRPDNSQGTLNSRVVNALDPEPEKKTDASGGLAEYAKVASNTVTVDNTERQKDDASQSDARPQAGDSNKHRDAMDADAPKESHPATLLQDTKSLEMETERYYHELLGKKDTSDPRATKQAAETLSAHQVAQITIGYKTGEEERRMEEERKREEEEKESKRKEDVETAWSVLHHYWQFVRDNPYDFTGWTYLLSHVESMSNMEAARSAFDGFLPLYPYCFAYWKKLCDMELGHGDTERGLGVLLVGIETIPFCTELWLPLLSTFATYVKERNLPPQHVRELYEGGLALIGSSWHSSSFWEACITHEQDKGDLIAVMGLYRRLISTPLRLYNKHWDHFLALVRDHHPRNLLPPGEYQALRRQACEELKIRYTPSALLPPKIVVKTPQPEDRLTSCIKEKVVASYIKTHEATEEEADRRWKYEEKIKRPYFHVKPLDKKRLKNWNDYLDFEVSRGDPLKVIPLFERCLVACALYDDIWLRYALYMEKHVQDVADGKYLGHKCMSEGSGDACGTPREDAGLNGAVEPTKGPSEGGSGETNDRDKSDECKANKSSENSENGGKESGKPSAEGNVSITDEGVGGGQVMVVASAEKANKSGDGDDVSCGTVTLGDSRHPRHSATDGDGTVALDGGEGGPQSDSTGTNTDNGTAKCSDENTASEKSAPSPPAETLESPQSLETLRQELMGRLSLSERVLRCPQLTPQWIVSGVGWEDVRQIYRRAVWIHCPNKPALLMHWAEFEEMQGNTDTARELLVTVITKHPTLIKARMQLIEMECRAGNHQRVEELYGEASRALTLPRHRSWLAIRYARFLFKILLEPERALVVLRKALKKDRGNTLLYHHVFDICYQRQPVDVQGVLASTLLALASKDLSLQDKCWFAYKRAEFLREHGDIHELKRAQHELTDLRLEAAREAEEAKAKTEAKEEEATGEEAVSGEEQLANKDAKPAEGGTAVEKASGGESGAVADPSAPTVVPAPVLAFPQEQMQQGQVNQQFPVPYFSADGAITYTPMAGYGYGHSDPNQALPTAQEVVQGQGQGQGQGQEQGQEQQGPAGGGSYHTVPHTWDYEIQSNSYRYDKHDEVRWHEEARYRQYNDLLANGYPSHLRDKQHKEVEAPLKVNIDHLRRRGGEGRGDASRLLPDLSQPPPAVPPGPPTNLPPPPQHFSRPPPFSGMAPPGFRPDQMDSRPPGEHPRPLMDSPHRTPLLMDPYGKRRLQMDYGCGGGEGDRGEPPYKSRRMMDDTSRLYRSEYDTNYTASPGPCAPPSHRSTLPPCLPQHSMHPYHHLQEGEEGGRGHHQERRERDMLRDTPELSRFNEADRYSLRDASSFPSPPLPSEVGLREEDGACVNVPDWLVHDGGELVLSETERGVSLIRYWPNFMTEKGEKTIFRILRKGLKWHQRRALHEDQWQNLPHLLSWIGPCDLTFSGVTLEKNTNWLPEIVDLLHRLIRYTDNQYNSCILSLFRNGYDCVTWMEENHPALRDNPSIASISLGTTRIFEMKRKDGRGFLRFPLYPGSLLLMEGATQEDWQHQFPKEPSQPGERIQLTFRKLYMIQGLTV